MSSPQGEAFTQAAGQARRVSQEAYGMALPALQSEYGSLNEALASGGEPDYMRKAQAGARAATTEGLAHNEIAALRASQAGKSPLMATNPGLANPQVFGTKLAQALYGPRVSEATGQIEQLDKLMGASIGQSQTTGSGALQATGTELRDIGMMRNYNMPYAATLAALNLGGSIYGAGQQAGWWGQYPSDIPYDPEPGLTSRPQIPFGAGRVW